MKMASEAIEISFTGTIRTDKAIRVPKWVREAGFTAKMPVNVIIKPVVMKK